MRLEDLLLHGFLFLAMYFEVFLLVTFFSEKKKIDDEANDSCMDISHYPTTTIIIPCWNEEKTIKRTLESLLKLNYPEDKLTITVVDDGSTDRTWDVLQEYAGNPRVVMYKKENGGKHTAVNYGIERTKSDLIGCLDADSFVDPMTLRKIVRCFEKPGVMAVTPAIRIHEPKTVIQHIQHIEYNIGIIMKKVFGLIGAIHVTPGPFSIFRREVFEKIGMFRHAHNTEDMEIAMRMHVHRMKIENSHTAWVYTVGPKTLKGLYRQRVRWTHGFIENALDYKQLFFNWKYGNLGVFTLPIAGVSIIGFLFIITFALINTIVKIKTKVVEYQAVGFVWKWPEFDWFYFNTKTSAVVGITLFVVTCALIIIAKKTVEGRVRLSRDVIFYFILYPLIAPLWLLKSLFNAIFSRKTSWR